MILEHDTIRDQFIELFVKLQKWDRLDFEFSLYRCRDMQPLLDEGTVILQPRPGWRRRQERSSSLW